MIESESVCEKKKMLSIGNFFSGKNYNTEKLQ